MFSKQQFYIVVLVWTALVFTAGILVGRWSKQCAVVTAETTMSDTTDTYVPITGGAGSPITVITYPQNKLIAPKTTKIASNTKKVAKNAIVVNRDTCFEFIDTCIEFLNTKEPIFTATDTLCFDSLFVAITDTGNCNGIISRHSFFGGKIKEKTITNTITKVVTKPLSLFQLNGGIQSSFNTQWQVQDIGPALQLQLKQKHAVGYSYMISTGTHNISLLTKLK